MGLLEFKRNKFSLDGEDGIIERIFSLVGTSEHQEVGGRKLVRPVRRS